MTDIRPIHESEADTFLQLLCDVYQLDFNRAYDLFFTEPLFDLDRKWAMFEGREMVSVLTTTPLEFGWGNAIGIAGVATPKARRSEGHAGRLIQKVLKESALKGESSALLFAKELALYERLGFEPLDQVVRGEVETQTTGKVLEPFDYSTARELYTQWSEGHEDRLRRDDKRWAYWCWNFKTVVPFQSGYLVTENDTLREAVFSEVVEALPGEDGTTWLGLAFMTDLLEIPLRNISPEMTLMGFNVPGQPQLFMTDQF